MTAMLLLWVNLGDVRAAVLLSVLLLVLPSSSVWLEHGDIRPLPVVVGADSGDRALTMPWL